MGIVFPVKSNVNLKTHMISKKFSVELKIKELIQKYMNNEDEFVEKVCIFGSAFRFNCCVFYWDDNLKCAFAYSGNCTLLYWK